MNAPTKAQSKDKMREAKPWVRRFGRFGYMTKGIVYGMIGVLAILAALGPGGETRALQAIIYC
jgi:hypothetical protein